MTTPYLGDDTPRWLGHTHDEILAMVSAGPGRSAAQYPEGHWSATWFSMRWVDAQLAKAIADIGSGWEGQGATATTAAVTPLGAWAIEGAEQAQSTSNTLGAQAEYADYTRREMPPNPHPGLIQNPSEGTPSDMLATWAAEDQARDNAAARAQELMQSYTYNSYDTVPGMLESVPPPTVTIATVSGGGGAGGGVGPLSTTSAADIGAASTAGAAAGGAGSAGTITSALGGPGAAPGTAGAGSAGPGATGAGSAGAGSAGTAGGSAGTTGSGPGGGIGTGTPAGVGAPAGVGTGGAAGAGARAGAGTAGGRPGGPSTASGPGRGATPSTSRSTEPGGGLAGPGASRASTGSIPGRSGSPGLGEPARPGNRWPVPEGPPRGPSASWPPIGSSPGTGGSERAGAAAPPARPGDPLSAPGRTDRGSPFPSSAPPSGTTTGSRHPGHAPMMPMGGAGGTQGEGRRRPSYLVDDGSAFADDRVIGSHIINEDPEDHRA